MLDRKQSVVDARSSGRFKGVDPEPRPNLPSGHMPHAINLPFTQLIHPGTNSLKSVEELKSIFMEKGIDLNQPLTVSCGSGMTACVVYAAAQLVGMKEVSVYDGSWTDYASHPTSVILTDK